MRAVAVQRLFAKPIAHRGLHGGNRLPDAPIENSVGAACAAIASGYGIECDIQLSRDGEAFVFHDEQLDRLTAAHGLVADRDASDLRAIRLGATSETIPTLVDFLALVGGRTPLVIEIKSAAPGDFRLAQRALALVAAYDGPVALESFDESVVAHCIGSGAPFPVGLVGPSESGETADAALVAACDFLSWSIDHLRTIRARYPDKPLSTWTVRTPAQVVEAMTCDAQLVFEGFRP